MSLFKYSNLQLEFNIEHDKEVYRQLPKENYFEILNNLLKTYSIKKDDFDSFRILYDELIILGQSFNNAELTKYCSWLHNQLNNLLSFMNEHLIQKNNSFVFCTANNNKELLKFYISNFKNSYNSFLNNFFRILKIL